MVGRSGDVFEANGASALSAFCRHVVFSGRQHAQRNFVADRKPQVDPCGYLFVGIDQFAESAVIVRARIKTLPGKQWAAGRAFNGIVKRVFDERGIEIPFPHRTLYLGQGAQGEAPVSLRPAGDAVGPDRQGPTSGPTLRHGREVEPRFDLPSDDEDDGGGGERA